MSEAGPLAGQVAIVTGGVRRIGKAIALSLARQGATVVVNALRSREEAEATVAEIAAAGGRAFHHLADVTDEAAVAAMMERVIGETGRVDILVNNAAIRGEAPIAQMSFAQWRAVTGIILDGAFLCSRAALPRMLAQRYGRIVNIGGVSAHLGAAGRAHVVTAKTGLVGLTRALASECAKDGITVNCVVPGRIGGHRSHTSGKGIAAMGTAGLPPVGHDGAPEDVADAVLHFCRPQAGYVTGQTLHVSGGMFMP